MKRKDLMDVVAVFGELVSHTHMLLRGDCRVAVPMAERYALIRLGLVTREICEELYGDLSECLSRVQDELGSTNASILGILLRASSELVRGADVEEGIVRRLLTEVEELYVSWSRLLRRLGHREPGSEQHR